MNNKSKAWNVFVQNRVKEIRSLTNTNSWRHVPGSMNQADLLSRGCSALSSLKSNRWLGPSWLYLPKEEWPNGHIDLNESEIVKEKKKKHSFSCKEMLSCYMFSYQERLVLQIFFQIPENS